MDFTLGTNLAMFLAGLFLSFSNRELPKIVTFMNKHPKVIFDLLE